MTARSYHDFFAPIEGDAVRFTMRCDDGLPVWIQCARPPASRALTARLVVRLDLVNHLLKSLPWAAFTLQGHGDIGAVLEAAEARRAEIYGPLPEAAA